jgi:hypothetical protein
VSSITIYQPDTMGGNSPGEVTVVVHGADRAGNFQVEVEYGESFWLDRKRAIELMAALDVLISEYEHDGEEALDFDALDNDEDDPRDWFPS